MRMPKMCDSCKHLRLRGACAAFPNGIPDEILVWGGAHSEVLPAQTNDVVWELSKGSEDSKETWDRFNAAKQARIA